jgi:hypothetical protein
LFNFALQVSILSASLSSRKNVLAVVDSSSGVPLSEVLVTAGGSGGFGYATTDNNGHFNITDGLMAGNYAVVASKQGYLNTENDSIMVTAGSEISGVTLYMDLSGGIFGRVTDNVTGLGIPDISVLAFPTSGGINYFGAGFTDSLGNYQIFTNLGTGTYNVSVFLPQGYVGKTVGPVSVTGDSKTMGINLSLQRSGIISGRITTLGGQPFPNANVTALGSSSFLGFSQTNATGYYRIVSGLGDDTYMVFVTVGGNSNSTEQPVNVTAGHEASNVNLELNATLIPSGIIMGTVMDASNHPIPHAEVMAAGDTTHSYESATADQDGNYKMSQGLSNDTYRATASAHGYQDQNFTAVSVVENQVTHLDFHLQSIPSAQSGRISGSVTGATNPIPEFQCPTAMLLVATLAVVIIAKSSNRKIKYRAARN